MTTRLLLTALFHSFPYPDFFIAGNVQLRQPTIPQKTGSFQPEIIVLFIKS